MTEYVIALVSGEGKHEVIEGYYAGWKFNEHKHPDGFNIAKERDGAQRFGTLEAAANVLKGDPRLGGAKILAA